MADEQCPLCGCKGLEIVWGTLAPVDDPNLVDGGCCVEPGNTHQCAMCGHRWGALSDSDPTFVDWLESECAVSVTRLFDRLGGGFRASLPRGPLECLDSSSGVEGPQAILGTPAVVVLTAFPRRTLEVAELGAIGAGPGQVEPVRLRAVRLFIDDLRDPKQRADHLAIAIKDVARRRRRAAFRSCKSCDTRVPPEWLLDDRVCIGCASRADTRSEATDTVTGSNPRHPGEALGERGSLAVNPENWPQDWPDVPVEWGARADLEDPPVVRTLAVAEVTTDHATFTVPVLAICGDGPDRWSWYDGGRWHVVTERPVRDNSLSPFGWQWKVGDGVARGRAYDPLTDERLEYVTEFN